MADNNEIILGVHIEADDAFKMLAEYQKKLDEVKASENELNKELKAGQITRDKYREMMAACKETAKDYSQQMRAVSKELQNEMRINREAEGSLNGLRSQLSNITAAYDALSREERNNMEIGGKLKEQINAVTDELKGAEEATQRYYRNVGNYENAIKNQLGMNSKWYQQLVMIGDVTKNGVSPALNTAATAVKGFGKQILALLANPIVLTLAAIAVAIKAVSDAIKSSEENTRAFERILAPFQGILIKIQARIQDITTNILALVEAAEGAAMALSRLAENIPLVGKYFKDYNAVVDENLEITKLEQKVTDDNREALVEDAKAMKEVAELRSKATERDKYSAADRIKYLEDAIKKEQEVLDRRKRIAQEEYEISMRRTAQAQNDAEANEIKARAEAKLLQVETEYFNQTRRMQTQLSTARIEEQREAKAAAEAAKKRAEERVKNEQEAQKAMLEAIRKGQDLMTAAITDAQERQTEALRLSIARQIEDYKAAIAEATKKGAAAALIAEMNANLLLMVEAGDRQMRELQEKYWDEIGKEAEDLASEYYDKMQKARQEDLQRAANDFTERIMQTDDAVEAARIAEEQKFFDLNNLQQAIGESDAAFYARRLQAQQAYNDAHAKLVSEENRVTMTRLSVASGIAGGLAKVFEQMGDEESEYAKLGKVLALAEVAINTGKAIAAGVAQAQAVPFPANLAAIGTTIATILGNIGTAISTIKAAKFSEGGDVRGEGTATSDSIHAMLSNGESVNTATTTTMFAPLLSALNQIGGGAPIHGGSVSVADNGGREAFGQMMAEALTAMPAPVVSVVDINDGQRRVSMIEGRASV